MFKAEGLTFLYFLHLCSCSWISEWLAPIQGQIKEKPFRRNPDNIDESLVEDVYNRPYSLDPLPNDSVKARDNSPSFDLKTQLENALRNAQILSETIKLQINEAITREALLKDSIVNGRSGVTAVTVTSMNHPPRSYMVRDGYWSLCNGLIHFPTPNPSVNLFSELFSTPRCIGHEMSSRLDPCVFNSIIKYETVPVTRRVEYSEDEFLCLKKSFNTTLERYMSVPQQIINDTCQDGVVRSLEDNVAKCGLRVMTEYTYYPSREYAGSSLPVEYCTEPDGACKLIIAWHVSNASIENFEFLENEQGFKKFFIKSGSYIEHVI